MRQQVFVFDRHPRPWHFIQLAVGAASLSYYLVERPMLWLREKRSAMKATAIRLVGVPSGELHERERKANSIFPMRENPEKIVQYLFARH